MIPAVGDEQRDGWIDPLNRAIYPDLSARRQNVRAPGCPEFRSKDSVIERPNGDPALPVTVSPGLHKFIHQSSNPQSSIHNQSEIINLQSAIHEAVWWDPNILELGAEPPLGIRRSELIVKDVNPSVVDEGMAAYRSWRSSVDAALTNGAHPSIAAQTATQWAGAFDATPSLELPTVQIVEMVRDANRPGGVRFGALVHAVLATVPLDAKKDAIHDLIRAHARVLGATDEESAYAARTTQAVLSHDILKRARKSAESGRCRREVPVTWRDNSGSLIEGVVDLAFLENDRWVVVDFKTDEEFLRPANYEAQVGFYAIAMQAATSRQAAGILMRL